MLQWVAVNGSDAHWSCPLVMSLVNVSVELWMVKQPECADGHKESRTSISMHTFEHSA